MTNPFRSFPRSAPGFWLTALFLFLALLFIAALVLAAEGQTGGTGWQPAPGTPTCWQQEQTGGCPGWMANPATGGCRGTINLAVPFELGADGTGAEAFQGRYGIPASAIRAPQGKLVRHCGPWDHTAAPQIDALRHEYWLRTGTPFVGRPSPQELTDIQYTSGAGLYALLPRVTGACESVGLSVTCRVASAFPPGMDCQTRWLDGIWRSAPIGDPVNLKAGTHDVFVACEAGSGVGASWATRITVPPAAPPPPPDPEPPPPPPAPEPVLPACGPKRLSNCTASGFKQEICRGCKCPAGVVPGQPPYCVAVPVEPPPPPSCAECEAGGFTDPLCGHCPCPAELVDPSGHVHTVSGRFCTPEPPVELCPVFRVVVTPEVIKSPKYIPGIPSAAQLTIQLVPQEWGPCE